MLRTLAMLAVIVTASCASALSGHPDYVLRIVSYDAGGPASLCGATAVGPDTIETATHCLRHRLTTVNGEPVDIVRSESVGIDRSRVVITGATFNRWSAMADPVQGERVRWWGHPMGWKFVYREGVVALVTDDGMAVDATICHGDSGSGIFNDKGELVGVVSAMTDANGCTFMVGR